jgi:hypothetical protein
MERGERARRVTAGGLRGDCAGTLWEGGGSELSQTRKRPASGSARAGATTACSGRSAVLDAVAAVGGARRGRSRYARHSISRDAELGEALEPHQAL